MPNQYFLNPDLEWYVKEADVVLYDMNGLIVDDEPLQWIASNKTIAELYESEGPNAISEGFWGQKCVGHHPAKWLPEVLRRQVDEAELEVFRKRRSEAFKNLAAKKAKQIVRPGVLSSLQYFKEIEKPLGLVTTSKLDVVQVLLGRDGLNILDDFNFKICADKKTATSDTHNLFALQPTSYSTIFLLPAGAKPKPDPTIYLLTKDFFEEKMERFDLDFLVFEDSSSGVRAAKGAGMFCFAVPNRYTMNQDLSRADAVIESQEFDTPAHWVKKSTRRAPACG